jgi:hypothetical protein
MAMGRRGTADHRLRNPRHPPRPGRNSYPTSPVGRRRVAAAYDVDMAELERVVAAIRERTAQWEATIADSWRDCERTTEGGVIVVTDAGMLTR